CPDHLPTNFRPAIKVQPYEIPRLSGTTCHTRFAFVTRLRRRLDPLPRSGRFGHESRDGTAPALVGQRECRLANPVAWTRNIEPHHARRPHLSHFVQRLCPGCFRPG